MRYAPLITGDEKASENMSAEDGERMVAAVNGGARPVVGPRKDAKGHPRFRGADDTRIVADAAGGDD